ncbi:MAG: Rrf2 family transcriptional regulator [Verrucomicrobiota bacterium]
MKLSKRGEYALRALIDLGRASHWKQPLVQIADLAERENLPLKFLEQILMQLKEAGLVESKRGKFGGYLLAMPASAIKFGRVIRLIDGPLAPVSCLSGTAYEPCTCPDPERCGLRLVMREVHSSLTGVLDRVTLADAVRRSLRSRKKPAIKKRPKKPILKAKPARKSRAAKPISRPSLKTRTKQTRRRGSSD